MSEAWKLGLYATDSLAGKVQKSGVATGSLNNSGTCMQVGGTNYQVTAGKTFYITSIRYLVHTDAQVSLAIRYADNAALTTNPVTLFTLISANGCAAFALGASPFPVIGGFGINGPATKYVGIFNAVAVASVETVFIEGYEV